MSQDTPRQFRKMYHFNSHLVFGIDNEPLACCVAGDKLLVSTLGHSIEVRKLDNYGSLSHSFNTVDLVKQMIYSGIGKYVATLEVKTTRLNLTTHVRLYFNWQVEASGMAMRARIAGRVTPSTQSSVGQLEMVELPLKQQACYVNCCPSTANLIIGCARCVSVYRFCVKVHPISKIHFQDVEPLLDIHVSFLVKEVAICEEYLAFMSSSEVQIVKINVLSIDNNNKLNKLNTNLRSVSLNSPRHAIDDPNIIFLNSPLNQQLPKLDNLAVSPTIILPSLIDPNRTEIERCNAPRVVIGPLEYFAGLPTQLEILDSNFAVSFRITCLLYQRFPSIIPASTKSSPYFCLHSLQFLPCYINKSTKETEPTQTTLKTSSSTVNPFRSSRRSHLQRLEAFYSGHHECHLYNIYDKVHLISVYKFDDRVYYVSVENTVLHAVSSKGVYTYSLHQWNRVIQHLYQDKPERQPCLHSFDNKNILLAFQPFVNVQLAAFGDDFLVLFTSICEAEKIDSASWTVYALQCPLAESIYNSLLEDDDLNCNDEQNWYLLHDAHCALAAEILLYNPPSSSRLSRLFQQASFQLGDTYLKVDPWSAVAFYSLPGSSLQDCVEHLLHTPEVTTHKNNICSALSLIFVKNYFDTTETLSQETADSVLIFIGENEPNLLSSLILKRVLLGYSINLASDLLLSKLRDRKFGSVEDTLAACICCVSAGQIDSLLSLMMAVTDESILNMVVKYPHVWLNDEENCQLQFTPLMQVIQQIKPELFVQILRKVITAGIAKNINVAGQLTQADCWEDYGLAHKNDSILLNVLEELLRNKFKCDEATIGLANLYIKSLTDSKELKLPQQAKPWRLFGSRQHWLNKFTPFEGRSLNSENCLLKSAVGKYASKLESEKSCSCANCNNSLLRLQSLLCCEAANENVKKSFRVTLESLNGSIVGGESLLILCSQSPADGVQRLLQIFPSAIVEYCLDNVKLNDMLVWKQIVEMLNSDLMANNQPIIEDVVGYLAQNLTPIQLAQLVPNGDFTAQMQRSVHKYQAKQIHNLIMTEGKVMSNKG
ncbi:Hermansky-Pudlak syndrome 3 [Chamberlinius hualienensis]